MHIAAHEGYIQIQYTLRHIPYTGDLSKAKKLYPIGPIATGYINIPDQLVGVWIVVQVYSKQTLFSFDVHGNT